MKDLQRYIKEAPARIFKGRSGTSYKTSEQLALRADHAFAKDAVLDESDLKSVLSDVFCQQLGIFEVSSLAETKNDFLLQPQLGRALSLESKDKIARLNKSKTD